MLDFVGFFFYKCIKRGEVRHYIAKLEAEVKGNISGSVFWNVWESSHLNHPNVSIPQLVRDVTIHCRHLSNTKDNIIPFKTTDSNDIRVVIIKLRNVRDRSEEWEESKSLRTMLSRYLKLFIPKTN